MIRLAMLTAGLTALVLWAPLIAVLISVPLLWHYYPRD